MTLDEAHQNISYFQSVLFLDYMNTFDYSILTIEYSEILNDIYKGEKDQIYKTKNDHMLYELMGWREKLQTLQKSIKKICDSKNYTNRWERYLFIIDKLPIEAQNYLQTQYLWF